MRSQEENFYGLEPYSIFFEEGEAAKIQETCKKCGFSFKIKKLADGRLELWKPIGRDLEDFWKEAGFDD